MTRELTLCTSQWIDLPLETLAQKAKAWGFDGLELSCGGDHFDVENALESDSYITSKRDLLEKDKRWEFGNKLITFNQDPSNPEPQKKNGISRSRGWLSYINTDQAL